MLETASLCSAEQNEEKGWNGMDVGSNRQMSAQYCMQMFTPIPLHSSCECYP